MGLWQRPVHPMLVPLSLLSRWRAVTKTLSGRDRIGILRKCGPVIEISKEALMLCEDKVRRLKSHGTSTELGKQSQTANSNHAQSSELSYSMARETENSTRTHQGSATSRGYFGETVESFNGW